MEYKHCRAQSLVLLLFRLFTNDLPISIRISTTILFADDATVAQKRAIRNVAKGKYNEQALQLSNLLSILKLNDLFNLQMAVFRHVYNMDILSLSLRQCFTRNDAFHLITTIP